MRRALQNQLCRIFTLVVLEMSREALVNLVAPGEHHNQHKSERHGDIPEQKPQQPFA